MDNTQHDRDESADIDGAEDTSRPDDPAVVAAAVGKTTPERSSKSQRQRQPSKRHNRGPPLDDDDAPVERLADDVLLGATSIAEHITSLGFPVDEDDVYYLHRAKKWPFNKYGAFLIASKSRLTCHAKKLLRAPAAADADGSAREVPQSVRSRQKSPTRRSGIDRTQAGPRVLPRTVLVTTEAEVERETA
jgi:hypothetical protein